MNRDERGYVLVLLSICMTMLLGVAGFAVDLGSWYREASRLQNAVDAAALAGVIYMPGDFSTARSVALGTASRNGFTNGSGGVTITVSSVAADSHRLKVCAVDDQVERFFSRAVGANPRISKCATARYVLPLAMGSPLNELSNAALGVYPAVSGYCSASEDGDEFLSGYRGLFPDHSWSTYTGCPPGGSSGPPLGPNPDYDSDGYDFQVDVKTASPTAIEVFDGAWSQTSVYDGVQGTGTTKMDTTYTVSFDNNTPLNQADDVQVANVTAKSGDAVWAGVWRSIATVSGVGSYRVNVVTSTNSEAHATNSFGVRARAGGSFAQCSSDATAANYSATCPQVYGIEHLSIDARVASSQANFYLASVDQSYAGQELVIDLYDPGEGGQSIEVLDPNGNPVHFAWRTIDTMPQTAGADAMAGDDDALDVSGAISPPDYTRNAGTFNDRKVRITVRMPDDYANEFGARTWWKLRYAFGSLKVRDRTTWSVSVGGDPVRLVGDS